MKIRQVSCDICGGKANMIKVERGHGEGPSTYWYSPKDWDEYAGDDICPSCSCVINNAEKSARKKAISEIREKYIRTFPLFSKMAEVYGGNQQFEKIAETSLSGSKNEADK